jgi:cysteine-rich repeat protein
MKLRRFAVVLVGLLGCGDDLHVNDPPMLSLAVTTAEDTPVTVVVPAADPEGRTVTYSASTPAHGTVIGSGPSFVYVPAPDFNGSDTFQISVSDQLNNVSMPVAVTVTPVDDAPVAGDDAFATAQNVELDVALTALLANDRDVDSSQLTITAVGGAVNGQAVLSSAVVAFTPTPGFHGNAGFTYTVSDGTLTATGHVTVTVSDHNAPPVAVDDAAATDEDQPLSLATTTLTANDTDLDMQIPTVIGVGIAVHGTVVLTGNTIVFTPDPNYNGPASFGYQISDGMATATGHVAVTVRPVNDAPVALDAAATTAEGTPVAVTLGATDVDSVTITYTVVTPPTHGTLSGSGAALTYTPATHYYGVDAFTFQASDGLATSNTATITLTVTNVIACGDGVVEGTEVCDDGNQVDTDACRNSCVPARCGDGVVQTGVEQCDDGNADNTDACLDTCASAACGDGFVQTGVEACDDGNNVNTDGCLNTCVSAACGDGVVQAGVEQCDDGNNVDTDACRNNCTAPACGDGVVSSGEECDDSNTNDDDGCSHSCLVERCGDGIIQLSRGEECDDGNTVPGDGCDASCLAEPLATVAPVKVSGALTCTTAPASQGNHVAVDGSGTVYAVMSCGTDAYVVASTDGGHSFSAPLSLTADYPAVLDPSLPVAEMTVAAGPTGTGYVAFELQDNSVYLRVTRDKGATWGGPLLVGSTSTPGLQLALAAFNDDVYVGFAAYGGTAVAINHHRAAGAFTTTLAALSFGGNIDVLYDPAQREVVATAEGFNFEVRASSDAGVTFSSEVNPPGLVDYPDWAMGGGNIFVAGTNSGGTGNAATLFIIPTSALSTSNAVVGLPVVNVAQSRSLAADLAGNAYVASELDSGGVRIDRLATGATSFDVARSLSPTGQSPGVATLPGNQGAAVVFTDGGSVYATIQKY